MTRMFLNTVSVVFAALLACFNMSAQQYRKPASEHYSITVLGVYDHSRTFADQGGLDIAGHLPFNTYVEADAGFEYLGPKILAGTFVARPKLPLKVGELFLDATIHLRAFKSFGTGTFSIAASFGYRMDYVSVQLGVQRTEILDFQKGAGKDGSNILEPLNPIVRIAVNVRPATSPWNISLGAGNFTLYQYERLYYPIISLGGHYDFANHLTARAEVDFKPSGIFNCTTNFNGISVRAGLTYRF